MHFGEQQHRTQDKLLEKIYLLPILLLYCINQKVPIASFNFRNYNAFSYHTFFRTKVTDLFSVDKPFLKKGFELICFHEINMRAFFQKYFSSKSASGSKDKYLGRMVFGKDWSKARSEILFHSLTDLLLAMKFHWQFMRTSWIFRQDISFLFHKLRYSNPNKSKNDLRANSSKLVDVSLIFDFLRFNQRDHIKMNIRFHGLYFTENFIRTKTGVGWEKSAIAS